MKDIQYSNLNCSDLFFLCISVFLCTLLTASPKQCTLTKSMYINAAKILQHFNSENEDLLPATTLPAKCATKTEAQLKTTFWKRPTTLSALKKSHCRKC